MGVVLKVDASNGQIMVSGAGRVNDLPNLAEDKIWVGDSNGHPVETPYSPPVFGTEAQDEESLSESQNSTTTWEQKVRITMPAETPAGKYRIGVSYNWWYSSSTQDFEGRVQVDDTTEVFTHKEEPQDTGTDQRRAASGFAYVDLTAAAHTIDLDYRSALGGNTAGILNARLEVWRVS